MSSPIDTIREALTSVPHRVEGWAERERTALAALTEVEHQLVERPTLEEAVKNVNYWKDKAVAAETALASLRDWIKNTQDYKRAEKLSELLVAAEQRANELGAGLADHIEALEAAEHRDNALADALRAIAEMHPAEPSNWRTVARAALDRHTQ